MTLTPAYAVLLYQHKKIVNQSKLEWMEVAAWPATGPAEQMVNPCGHTRATQLLADGLAAGALESLTEPPFRHKVALRLVAHGV